MDLKRLIDKAHKRLKEKSKSKLTLNNESSQIHNQKETLSKCSLVTNTPFSSVIDKQISNYNKFDKNLEKFRELRKIIQKK